MKKQANNGYKEILDLAKHLSIKEKRKLVRDINRELEASSEPIHPRENIFGCMKGLVIYMGEDFNAPLDDFKDYM